MNDENRNLALPQSGSIMGNIFASKETFELAQRIARMFSQCDMVPKTYRGEENLASCMIALDMSARLNANPLMVMQSLNVVEGRPGWASKFLISTVNAHPGFGALHYVVSEKEAPRDVEWTDYVWNDNARRKLPVEKVAKGIENIACHAWAIDRETGEKLVGPTVDIVMAIKERWYYRRNSKWQTMPGLMLRYRAASMWVSIFAPQLSMGIPTEEERRDVIDVTPTVTVPTETARSEGDAISTLNASVTKDVLPAQEEEKALEPAAPAAEEKTAPPTSKPEEKEAVPEKTVEWPQANRETGGLVDSRGIPYNETFHSGAKTCNPHTGIWRIRKGADRSAMAAWEKEITQGPSESDEEQATQQEEPATPQQEQEEEPKTWAGLNVTPEWFYDELKKVASLDQLDEIEDVFNNKEVLDLLPGDDVLRIGAVIESMRSSLEQQVE